MLLAAYGFYLLTNLAFFTCLGTLIYKVDPKVGTVMTILLVMNLIAKAIITTNTKGVPNVPKDQ